MMTPGSIAASVRPVSQRLSPFDTLVEDAASDTIDAPSCCAAISKEARVRVLAS